MSICHCCRPQDAETHVVPNLLYSGATNSPEACEAAAKAANYGYFAMQKGVECWWVAPAALHGVPWHLTASAMQHKMKCCI
jgi:hypothetical protein